MMAGFRPWNGIYRRHLLFSVFWGQKNQKDGFVVV